MDSFMNPQKNRPDSGLRPEEKEQPWNFIESALLEKSAPEPKKNPINIKCPSCAKQILTKVEAETYSKTHFCAAALAMSIVCCPLACLVYLVDFWKKKHHYCPHCRFFVGSYG